MPKRLIDLDDDLLAAAQRELNTTGIADTVRTALQQAAARSARVRQVSWLQAGGMAELADPTAAVLALQHRWVVERGSVD